jgi:subtilisin
MPTSTNVTTVSLSATHSKVISPTVDQDMKARGVAQVIAVLGSPTGTAVAVRGEDAAQRVEACFRTFERSQSSALRQTFVTRGTKAATAVPPEQAAITYPNLGVVLGNVDLDGLAALQASPDVVAICGTPSISLIRPERIAAATPKTGVTWGIEHLGVPALWRQGLTGKDVPIGHLDTGVDGKHPTFKGAIAKFAEFELSLGQRIQPDPAPHDSGEHGTHTAATIAGRPVAGRHIGVAHGALLYSGLVIEDGNVVARVLGGLDWAIETGVKIVSMSLGFRGWWEDCIPIVQIIRARGILPIIAVGNEGPGSSRSPGNYPTVLSVGAADESPAVAPFSSSQKFARAEDPLVPDLVAPGVNIISAKPGNAFQSMSGSSMATPHIAGLAALLWEAKPSATAGEIEKAILDSCRLLGTLTSDRANRGQPDAAMAFTRLTGQSVKTQGKAQQGRKQRNGPAKRTGKKTASQNRGRPGSRHRRKKES